MLGYLKGTILHQDLKSVVLDVSGVGYKIYTNTTLVKSEKAPTLQSGSRPKASALKVKNQTAAFWTHLAVRENALDLYGFATREELDFFELLITVSGIGPKSAMTIMTVASLRNLREAIATGDTTHLVKVSGVGKKSAEKIVLELKDRFADVGNGEFISGDVDALEALKSLGYGEREAREALKKVTESKDTSDKVKKALKILS